MSVKSATGRSCAYVVSIEKTTFALNELRSLSEYLSTLRVSGCEVIVLDSSARPVFEANRSVLRWVSRHFQVQRPLDVVRTAAAVATSERIIVAGEDVRYSAADIADIEELLDMHEVVEPQEYLDPLPWWGGIDAARMLMHRGLDGSGNKAASFAFRRSALNAMPGFDATDAPDPARRMASFGAELFPAFHIFVRREPEDLRAWLRSRPRAAGEEFTATARSAFFFALIPAMLLLGLFAGGRAAGGALAAVAVASVVLALRGRAGAAPFFPIRACLFAPLWLAERSLSVYWALAWRLQHSAEPARAAVQEPSGTKVASGE